MAVRAIRHAGIVVSDVERSLSFYSGALGLTVSVDQHETGEFIGAILSVPGVSVRTVKLAAPEGETLLELLQFNHGAHQSGDVGDPRRLGPTHVALTVEDLDGLHHRLAATGVRFLSTPQTSPDGRARVAFCRDPDGVLVELVQPLAD